jgi:hypothetical protein
MLNGRASHRRSDSNTYAGGASTSVAPAHNADHHDAFFDSAGLAKIGERIAEDAVIEPREIVLHHGALRSSAHA